MNTQYKVPIVPSLSARDINRRALNELNIIDRDYLQKPKPIDILKIVEVYLQTNKDYEFDIEDLPSGYEGFTDIFNKRLVLSSKTYDDLCEENPRARFTAAHEFGHSILHGNLHQFKRFLESTNKNIPKFNRSSLPAYCDPEWQANKFAACFLMPEPMVQKLIINGCDYYEIARIFNVSLTSAEIRFQEVKKKTTTFSSGL